MKIDDEIIKNVVSEQIRLAVTNALTENKEDLIAYLVKDVLAEKVDYIGKPSNSWDSKKWLDFEFSRCLRRIASEVIEEKIKEMAPDLKNAISEHMSKHGVDNLAKALVENLVRVDIRYDIKANLSHDEY